MGGAHRGRSWSQECRGDDADAVRASVGGTSSCDDDCVEKLVPKLCRQPTKVPHVVVIHGCREFDLNCDHSSITAFDDEVDLALAAVSTKLSHASLGGLGGDPDTKRDGTWSRSKMSRDGRWEESPVRRASSDAFE